MSDLKKTTFELDKEASSEINKIYSVTVPIEVFKEWAQTQNMPGFRPGKVPLRMLKKDEFLKHYLADVLADIKKQDNIDVVFASNYVVNKFDYDTDIQLTLSVEKVPTIKAINFKNIEVQTFKAFITEENVTIGINNYSNYHSKATEKISTKSRIGDFLHLEIEIEDLKTHQIEKSTQDVKLGSNTLITAVEEALEDKEIGYCHTHKANENVIIKLTIKSIKESEPLNENEIIEKLNIQKESIADFFKKKLESEAEIFANNLILDTIKKAILDTEFEIPLSTIQREFKKAWDQTLINLNYLPEINLEEFIQNKLGISSQEFQKNVTNIAAAHAKIRFMYYTIAKEQNIKIKENEINEALQSQARFFNNNIEETKKFYEKNEEAKEEILEQILFSKISEMLIAEVQKIPAKEISLDDLYKINSEKLQYKMLEGKE